MPRVLYAAGSGSASTSTGFTRDLGPPATVRLTTSTDQVALGTAAAVTGRKLTVRTTGANQGIRAWLTAVGDMVLDALVNAESFPRMELRASGLSLGPGSGALDWVIARTGTALAAITGMLQTQGRIVQTNFGTSTPYAVTIIDEFVGRDATGGNKVVELPAAVTGRRLIVKNTAALAVTNTVAVTPNGAETIDVVAGALLLTGTQSVTLIGQTGVGWSVV